jgi:hypothetical protein
LSWIFLARIRTAEIQSLLHDWLLWERGVGGDRELISDGEFEILNTKRGSGVSGVCSSVK